MEEFDLNHDGKVTLDEFKLALGRMKEKLNKKAQGAKEYTSYNKMRDDRYKHKRMEGELQDKYKMPQTFNQSIGFHSKDEKAK